MENPIKNKTAFDRRLRKCPHGDSNSSLSLERASSWAPRRWGRAHYYSAPLTHISGVAWNTEAAYAEAGEIVSSTHSTVNDEHMQFFRSMHADGQCHFDICGTRWTRNQRNRRGVSHRLILQGFIQCHHDLR
jgi:hypothetical protein